jgi:hypothetical protein
MTNQPAAPPADAKRLTIFFYLMSITMIGTFLWRTIVPAHEYPSRASQILDLVVDAGILLGLLAIRKAGPQGLFWIAVVCGIGLFAIRFHSDASWWTGHWHYSLSR